MSLEASKPGGQRIVWTARSGARFEVEAATLPSHDKSTMMIRLVPRQPVQMMMGQEPLSHLARDAGLTPREASILEALSRGRSHEEAAADLGVSNFTVTTHVRNLFAKLGVNNRIDAINVVRRGSPRRTRS